MKKNKKGIIGVIVIALCFIVTVSVVALYGGKVSASGLWNTTSYYLLSMESFDNLSLAREAAFVNRDMGGAGYVLKYGDKYKLIAAVYDSKADAEKVAGKQENGCEIIEASVQSFSGLKDWHSDGFKALSIVSESYAKLAEAIEDIVSEKLTNEAKYKQAMLALGSAAAIKQDFAPSDEESEAFYGKLTAAVAYLSNLAESELTVADFRFAQVAVVTLFCA